MQQINALHICFIYKSIIFDIRLLIAIFCYIKPKYSEITALISFSLEDYAKYLIGIVSFAWLLIYVLKCQTVFVCSIFRILSLSPPLQSLYVSLRMEPVCWTNKRATSVNSCSQWEAANCQSRFSNSTQSNINTNLRTLLSIQTNKRNGLKCWTFFNWKG